MDIVSGSMVSGTCTGVGLGAESSGGDVSVCGGIVGGRGSEGGGWDDEDEGSVGGSVAESGGKGGGGPLGDSPV